MREILIYTCERCGVEFPGKNKRNGRVLCSKCTDIEWEAKRRELMRRRSMPHGKSLSQVAAEAMDHGISYGQWVARKAGEHSGY